ncbi:MAG: carbohydrate kinase family protein [Phycisphaerales bacterium]|nr:carbohydrate kinase family protein [Phycisphaerales bacterium]
MHKTKILFIGDINVDVLMGGLESLPVVDKEITCKTFDIAVGSSAVICAAAYTSLGGDSSFLGLAGQDDYGNFMIHAMNELKINTDLVRRTDTIKTGVTINLIHASTRTQVTYPGTICEFDGSDVGEREFKEFSHIHFAGPYLQTKFRPHIIRLLQLAKSLNITTSLDPQWDPREKWEHMNDWLPLLTYLFVNEGEAMSIVNTLDYQSRNRKGATSIEDACRALANHTATPIVKTGKDGSMAISRGRGGNLARSTAKQVQVIDTTGAGDCFDAGFLFATFEKQLPLAKALQVANATGSRSCTFPGGVAHKSTWSDITHFMET